jgi:hypothetical protein
MSEKKILSHEEVLEILSEQAQNGSVTAAAALERALRARAKMAETSFEDELEALTR